MGRNLKCLSIYIEPVRNNFIRIRFTVNFNDCLSRAFFNGTTLYCIEEGWQAFSVQ